MGAKVVPLVKPKEPEHRNNWMYERRYQQQYPVL